MIDNILGNKTNLLVLRFLTKFNEQFFPADEISKATGAGLRNVYDSLRTLTYDKIISKRITNGKTHYRFIVNTSTTKIISDLFEDEKNKIIFNNLEIYKIISEVESKIVKIAGPNIIDLILYGSIAKGRDTPNSDIDLCVILNKENDKIKKEINKINYENELGRELQIQIFSFKEFETARKSQNPLILNIIRDGFSLKAGK